MTGTGAYVPSRLIQLEAKRLNYAPECPPHFLLHECLVAILSAGGSSGWSGTQAQAADETGDTVKGSPIGDWAWARITSVWRAFQLVMLWPGGYGAEPERAIKLLIVATLVFGLAYALYARFGRRNFEQTCRAIVDLGRIEGLDGATRIRLGDLVGQLRGFRQTLSAEAVAHAVSQKLLPELRDLGVHSELLRQPVEEIERRAARFGNAAVFGFNQFDEGKRPAAFGIARYTIDTMVPLIDLHAYSRYQPVSTGMRTVSLVQHIFGWWWITVFIASFAIL